MGADLYINKIFKPNSAKYEKLFYAAVEKRNAAPTQALKDKAQKEVTKYYEKMNSVGYFRDSYNDSSLLWQFDLSWWSDMGKMIENGNLSPKKAQELLDIMKEREPIFEAHMKTLKKWQDMKPKEVRTYFREKYKKFQQFLGEAIKQNLPIECSI